MAWKHCYVPWSFGQEGDEEHKVKLPCGIATNSSGQFIFGDINKVKIFDPTGHFIQHFSPPNDDVETVLCICDVATDNKDNIYVLVRFTKMTGSEEFVVYELSNTADLHHKFTVRGDCWARLTVTNSKVLVLVLSWSSVFVYDTDGLFVCSFGEGTLKGAWDITAANDSRVMVVEWDDFCVHIFSEDGAHLAKFKLQGRYFHPRIAFHQLTEHVVMACKKEGEAVVVVEIFIKDGEFVRSTPIHEQRIGDITGMTVTRDGRIVLLLRDINDKWKVLVI